MSKQIETDLRTFLKFWLVPLGIAGVLFFIYKAVAGLVIIGISLFLALALKPLVRKVNEFFTRHFGSNKKHQTSSAIFAYFIVVLIIGSIIAIVGPVVVNETSKFINNFPQTFETTFGGWEGINNFGKSVGIDNLQAQISNVFKTISDNLFGNLGTNLISSVTGVAGIVMNVVLVLVLTLLILLEGPEMMDVVWKSLGAREEDRKPTQVAKRVLERMANVISTYVSRQVMVAAIDGAAAMAIVFVLALIFGFQPTLAIPMGMITMTFYMIPMFGQFIGGTLVTALLLFSNPIAGAVFAVVYIIYAQIENNIISPKIQGNALNLQPVVILSAVVIGMYMFGLLGAIIAIPIAGCIRVLIEEYPNIKAARD